MAGDIGGIWYVLAKQIVGPQANELQERLNFLENPRMVQKSGMGLGSGAIRLGVTALLDCSRAV